jgi:hypothetical protein
MLRRPLLALLIAAFCLSSGGCYFVQLFLYDLFGEGPIPGGKLTCITCVKYPISPGEVMGGTWEVSGLLQAAPGEKLPKKVLVQLMAKDADENVVGKQKLLVKVSKTGALTASKELKELVVPMGGYLCIYLKPKGADINPGARLMWLDFQYPEGLEAAPTVP